VQKRILSITSIVFLFSIIIAGCSKLDTTDIGSDLLPAVDNVTTFDTLLDVTTTQGVFNLDSTQVANSDDHVLGRINADPLFGSTIANVYAQFKPAFYPFYYGNAKDTINPALAAGTGFDSVVLCLSYKSSWGDTTSLIDLQVKEIPYQVNNNGNWDSIYLAKTINYAPATGAVIGTAQVNVANLNNYTIFANHKDSVKNQIRIKLSSGFANKLFALDTNYLGANSPFRSDSLFKAYTNGIAVIANAGGNSILYTNLTDTSSRLEVHYRRKNGAGIDTTFTSFKIVTTATGLPSSTANNIIRNRLPQVTNPLPDALYLQATPGTYANLFVPALSTISNRIIHRAEIIVQQIPDNPVTDGYFSVPNYLYLDLKDTGTTAKWKAVYYDLSPNVSYDPDNTFAFYFPTSSSGFAIDYGYFGGFAREKTDVFGKPVKFYNFNITRHVQQIVTKHTNNYTFRLYAPYDITYPQFSIQPIPFSNRLGYGRVKVGSGTNPNYTMKLRLVYSRI